MDAGQIFQVLFPIVAPVVMAGVGVVNARNERAKAAAKQDEIEAEKDKTLIRTNDELWRRLRVVEDERETLKGSITILAQEVEILRKSNVSPSELSNLREKVEQQAMRIEAMQIEINELKADNLAKSNENALLRGKLEEVEKSNQVLKIENDALNRVLTARGTA